MVDLVAYMSVVFLHMRDLPWGKGIQRRRGRLSVS